ncbi:biotin-dependent carboxyltransferase family protein [Pseudonocardia acaciae]|uniref:5-oxoprolinase subunit C family protein n=1 Tax=Pseudonocardia acaciae TaxID=551276 RepID=UPI00048B54F7|nr:biotin-dependent carboxyltransferase family protein [Pseudonocardia acaciae]
MTDLEVVRPGVLATVQDLGRPGLAELGVGPSGAADRRSFRLANRLVANPEGAAAVEVTLGGFAARAHRPLTVAVTGASCPVRVDGRRHGLNAVLLLAPGQLLELAEPERGLRSYVGVRGGLAVEPVLGSRSTDVLAGLGPPPLRPGTMLPVGPAPAQAPAIDLAPVAAVAGGELVLRVLLGPRHDWFEERAVRTLLTEPYTVSTDSNRVGMRLEGPTLPRTVPGELPSEGLVPGAIQVPTLGRPTLFLADHPLTGGYPVIAVVRSADVDSAAQACPGQVLRFRLDRVTRR